MMLQYNRVVMNKIRIGKEFLIRWTIKVNGENSDLQQFDWTVRLISPFGRRFDLDYIIEQNAIVLTISRQMQRHTGVYRLEAWVNKDKDGQSVVDCCNAFTLVNCTCEEHHANDSNISVSESISLDSDMVLGVQGKSAYQTWLDEGNEGSEHDFLDWLRRPAADGGSEAVRAARLAETAAQNVNTAITNATSATNGANLSAAKADKSAGDAVAAANDATRAAAAASKVAEEGKPLVENLKQYDIALTIRPTYESVGVTNDITI